VAQPHPSSSAAVAPGSVGAEADREEDFVVAGEAEEFVFEGADQDAAYPPNLNLASLREVSPGVWTTISNEEHLTKLEGLIDRRQRHIDAWTGEPLKVIQGHTVLPALEAPDKTSLHSQPTIEPAASQSADDCRLWRHEVKKIMLAEGAEHIERSPHVAGGGNHRRQKRQQLAFLHQTYGDMHAQHLTSAEHHNATPSRVPHPAEHHSQPSTTASRAP
jgi:hypothetical protein